MRNSAAASSMRAASTQEVVRIEPHLNEEGTVALLLCAFPKGQIADDYPLVLGIVIDAQVMGKPGTEVPRKTVRILLKPKLIGVARGKIVAKNAIPALTHYTDPPVGRNHRWREGIQNVKSRASGLWMADRAYLSEAERGSALDEAPTLGYEEIKRADK